MKKLKIILSVFIIILLGIGTNRYIKNTSISEPKNEISNEIINSTIIETAKEETKTEVENTSVNIEKQKNTQNIIENKVISEKKQVKKEVAKTEVVIPEEMVIETVQEVSIPIVENTNKEIIENNPVEKEEIKETVQPEIPKEEPKQEPGIPKTKPEVNVHAQQPPTEEYRYNDAMTQQMISIINSNPSQFMISDGYSVVVDGSIVTLTNQFTFTEERVKNKILYKAGTIKVYAQDYYVGGQYLFTECYIM